jgi:hypothetical protein
LTEKTTGKLQGGDMRINVYAEELTQEIEIVRKKIDDGREFIAVRLFLKSAKELHHTETDDDRSAITFWVPWYDGKNHPHDLNNVFHALHNGSASLLENPDSEPVKRKKGETKFP